MASSPAVTGTVIAPEATEDTTDASIEAADVQHGRFLMRWNTTKINEYTQVQASSPYKKRPLENDGLNNLPLVRFYFLRKWEPQKPWKKGLFLAKDTKKIRKIWEK